MAKEVKGRGSRGGRQSKTRKRATKGKGGGMLSDLRYGRSLSINFFKKNGWLLMLIVVAVLGLMGLRYKTKTKMAEIKKLTTELQRAESTKLQEKAQYMTLIRESELKKLVEEKGLNLQFQEQPPYEIVPGETTWK